MGVLASRSQERGAYLPFALAFSFFFSCFSLMVSFGLPLVSFFLSCDFAILVSGKTLRTWNKSTNLQEY